METYDCDKCYAQTESDEDLHLTKHIGCGGTWIWDDGYSMTETHPTLIRFATADELSDKVAELEQRCAAFAASDAAQHNKIAALEAQLEKMQDLYSQASRVISNQAKLIAELEANQ